MQTQQDLINLIGLKIVDEKLISHFDALGIKQPKSCTPNNSCNETNYALFAKALDENLALYNRLMKLPVNREYYVLD